MDVRLPGEVTQWLLAWGRADEAALEQVVPRVYGELRRLARRQLWRERPDHSLQSADLVNELYLRLARQRTGIACNRAQFLTLCCALMRRILVDHARRRRCAKREGEARKLPLDAAAWVSHGRHEDVLRSHVALELLEEIDERKARIVELRFFGGFTIAETAEALAVSHATVEREWRLARAWLYRELKRSAKGGYGEARAATNAR